MNPLFSSIRPVYFLALSWVLYSPEVMAQHEEVRQNIQSLEEALEPDYEPKTLNLTAPDLGALGETEAEYTYFVEYKSKEKRENALGNNAYVRVKVMVFAWENEADLKYVFYQWTKRFLEGGIAKPGRTSKTYEYGKPTVVIVGQKSIALAQISCNDYSDELFRAWVKTMEGHFNEDQSMTIELKCGGPLEWTRNAPDPKARFKP
ncbi:hypothetical protein GC167_02960 [bacterium]|nr:hypothetical protein [bacterium]